MRPHWVPSGWTPRELLSIRETTRRAGLSRNSMRKSLRAATRAAVHQAGQSSRARPLHINARRLAQGGSWPIPQAATGHVDSSAAQSPVLLTKYPRPLVRRISHIATSTRNYQQRAHATGHRPIICLTAKLSSKAHLVLLALLRLTPAPPAWAIPPHLPETAPRARRSHCPGRLRGPGSGLRANR